MTRALVLGGGGPVGIAWESGLVVGLARRGIDLGAADRVQGTSAGSVVGARLALGHDLADDVAAGRGSKRPRDGSTSARPPDLSGLMEAMAMAAASDGTPEEARAILGRFALAQSTPSEDSFVDVFADLAGADWPAAYSCTAVHATTGEFVVWDVTSGVEVQRAVASSCSVPGIYPPITIGDARYIDGGMRSALNADLVAGSEVAIVVSCMPVDSPGAAAPAELDTLRSSGTQVGVVEPDEAFRELTGMGMFLMDSSRTPAAYDLGVALADDVADRIGALWCR